MRTDTQLAYQLRTTENRRATTAHWLLIDTGLEQAALLKEHRATLDKLTALIVDADKGTRLGTLAGKTLESARAILQALPQTVQIKQFLSATEKGPVKYKV
jgi:hypothetical protein